MLRLDGSLGEGGGQILRTALALSVCTGTPFRIENVRAGRRKPGLLRQHLTAVRAAARVGCAEVSGDELGSRELAFRPGAVLAGHHEFDVGSAGSAMLVLQTILPPLLTADGPSTVHVRGGTHNPMAPPFDFFQRTFLPCVERAGASVRATLHRAGFFPAGGGHVELAIEPAASLVPFELVERGEVVARRARALLSRLDAGIGERELETVRDRLGLRVGETEVVAVDSPGPGNALDLSFATAELTETFTGFGQRGVSAERVARQAVSEAKRWLAADVPVGEHLADQLLVPLALAGGGVFRTLAPSQHTRTNAEVVERFLPVSIELAEERAKAWRATVTARA